MSRVSDGGSGAEVGHRPVQVHRGAGDDHDRGIDIDTGVRQGRRLTQALDVQRPVIELPDIAAALR